MEIADHIEALAVQGPLLADAAESAGLDAAVPTCPGWTVRELVRHIGAVHRWAGRHVREARPTLIAEDLESLVRGWPDDRRLVAWFRDGHAELVEILRTAPPDVACASFLVAPSPLAMWARRQAHETTIHRVDAQAAAGTVTEPPAALASDGVDELLVAFITRPRTRLRLDPPRTIEVVAEDTGAAWRVEVGPTGIVTTPGPSTHADLRLSGTAPTLYLFLWNRSSADALTVTGDTTLLTTWRDQVRVTWS